MYLNAPGLLSRSFLAITLWVSPPALLVAQVEAPAPVGLLVVAHGADSAWNARVDAVVASVKWPGPVERAFLMGSAAESSSWDHALARLTDRGATRAIAVPLMVSTYGAHVRQMQYYAGEIAELPPALASMGHMGHDLTSNPIPVSVTGALDGAPELGIVLRDRFVALPDRQRSAPLVLVAHGPSHEVDVSKWLIGIHEALAPLAAAHTDAPIRIGLLRDDADPPIRAQAIAGLRDTITALAIRAGDSVTVMTVLISSGEIDRVKVPNDLAGLPIRYVGSVLAPHPALADWIVRIASAERDRVTAVVRSPQVDRHRLPDQKRRDPDHH